MKFSLTDIAIKSCKSPKFALALFLIHYFFSISLSILQFAVIYKSFDSIAKSNTDYVLASILRFTANADIGAVIGNSTSYWILAFQSGVGFYYIVIAILAFGSLNSYSAEEFGNSVEDLLKNGLTLIPNKEELVNLKK